MNQTYGFVEVWLAQILNIEYFDFALENGAIAAAVDDDGFNTAFNTMVFLWDKLDKEEAFKPAIYNSIIAGMKLAIHKYWANDDLLNDLTGEVAKASETYLNVVAVGPGRFNLDGIKDEINNQHATPEQEVPADAEAVPEEQVVEVEKAEPEPEPEPVVIPEWVARMEKIVASIGLVDLEYATSFYTTRDVSIEECGVRVMVYRSEISDAQFSQLVDVAKDIKKSIICVTSAGLSGKVIEFLKTDYDMTELSKHVLFFVYSHPTGRFSLTENVKALCFGHEIDEMYSISGTTNENEAINKIRGDTSISEAEREEKVSVIIRERKNSPIYKYDGIYKDTITNIIWAVQDRCLVYFLVPYSFDKNKNFYKIVYQEFVRRHMHALPYNELVAIDTEYMAKMHTDHKDDYVKFAIESSMVITDQIKKKMKEHHEKYKELLDQAMEHAKMFQRFHDQITYFNEDKFMEDERKKAYENFEQAMAIDKISAITVKDNTVHVYTHNIYAQDERTSRWHDIGTFHIAIGMHSNAYDTSKTVSIKNTKHEISISSTVMNAPHVWQNGSFCHGNLANGMTDAYKRRNLFELVYQIVLFLESANTSDAAGEKVNRWPEVSAETALNTNYNGEAVYEVMSQMVEAEKKFDEAIQDAIPIHI